MIALASIGQVVLLEHLFSSIIVPDEAWRELSDRRGAPEPALLAALSRTSIAPTEIRIPAAALSLHAGEQQVIAVALRRHAAVILDEGAGRKVASSLDLHVVGTLGIIIEAKRQNLVAAVRPLLTRLRENGFHISDCLITQVLASVGE